MKRRTFLQLGTATAVGALLAGCQSKNEKLIPFLIPPDEGVTPGLATYYASACRFCPAGCGILVRVADGRAKKIEGNPLHPVNRGRLCAMGQATLQELYHPDRIAQPLKRTGPRGSGQFAKISWQEGLTLLSARLKELQRENKTDGLAFFTPPLQGSQAELVGGFLKAFGSSHHLSFDPLAPDWLRTAGMHSFGQATLPFYDLAETRYLLSFGADFVEHHLSPVQYGNAFGRMRQGRDTIRGHFTYVGGRMSLTAASADRWLPARPGSEGVLALGMVRLILAEALFDGAALADAGLSPGALLSQLQGYTLTRVAEQTGLAGEQIAEVAREFATTRPSVAMAGEPLAFQTNGGDAVRSVQLLNLVAGAMNRPGGIYPDAGAPNGEGSSVSDLLSFVGKMRDGRITVALVQGDPVHTISPASGFREALAKVPYVVSFATLMDDTALQADLILPDHAALESWGDLLPLAGTRKPVVGLMQPVVTPLFDTRQFADQLLALAHELGGATAAALPYASYQELLRESLRKRTGSPKGPGFEAVWTELLRQGGLFEGKERKQESKRYRWSRGAALPRPEAPRFAGDENQFPLHLQLYRGIAFSDGRGAPLPWLQQLPDPMSTVVWNSWVEINPQTAARFGIRFGDLVEVASPAGSLRLPAVIYPGIRPDLVAIPLGQGYRDNGRYARGRGVNPLELLAPVAGHEYTPAWNATRVRLTRISDRGGLVTAGHPEGSYRSDLMEI